ncbi:AAA family ATPase [Leptolyngbya sp. FACHB-321]|uniref:R3H domain-containing nucleic acid-binding protein n=1 Tax=Leptolyngbya sp. FACHB-321 TaxID=2692807 RepID=UPI001682ED67|nr:R3H domain-containing nucleic acid-binding protein [Leptolyngbya sp. FACHB-321]MBD2033451.1 AAA family ATPase [Leptolyngbya sp. FACHB-321]
MYNTDDLQKLLELLPQDLQQRLARHPQRESLVEVVLDLGRCPEARFPSQAEFLSEQVVTHEQLQGCLDRVGPFGADNRAGIEKTLHRISAIRNRKGEIIGLTCRVGRALFGTIAMIRDLVETGHSILMLGRPGVGKTTALREIARVLADDLHKRVVIIDSSNEIAGDGDIPHPAIGRARRMQVARPELQHQVMIEAVENHMPEVIVIDEIGTELEALVARTIAERGVQLVGTAHGNQLENLIKNPTLADLVGGIQSVTLGDEEARRRGSQKSVLERKAPPTFDIAVEMQERQKWTVHECVSDTVDRLLLGNRAALQVRTVNDQGQVTMTREVSSPAIGSLSAAPLSTRSPNVRDKRRPSKRVLPVPKESASDRVSQAWQEERFKLELERYPHPRVEPSQAITSTLAVPSSEGQLRLYPYGIERQQLQQVIEELSVPFVLVADLEAAEAVLALKSHLTQHSILERLASEYQMPIHMVNGNTVAQITETLRSMFVIETKAATVEAESSQIYSGNPDDEWDALEEARLAVEAIVIPKGQPVELLPRSAHVRQIQQEFVDHYRLKSNSVGPGPDQRLRIYPA